ncbi:UDP-4-amino-4,6-dideoxy-N-acetyl-beta-L-altrosamine N-acetyltransferase [Vibrio sinaloensis]|uniref:N-acetyltransferase domain-containing protein n=1 Tax=Photobacterium sp. (strain ATCC 43367) TaxID=379097 RepID=A0A0A5HUP7_PHOS4|nr:UDP-4-amino-4,6-dideoxy-N-acetyl-beta-L-altrosamine N-acetyltransferase [Vibrio sinaloensis]KGY07251.1 hypothetical protein NM06_17930 [Vibrio sinaloensis]
MKTYNLRPAREEDKWMILEWRNHPEVRSVMLTDHEISRSEHTAWWDKTMSMAERQILVFEREDTPVGVVTIYSWNQENATAWWGFYLDNKNLNQQEKTSTWLELEQAVIHYSGSVLKVHELYCESLRENMLAWTLHEKCGFVECEAPSSATDTSKKVVYMKHTFSVNKPDNRPSLYLFSSHNTDFLSNTLEKVIKSYSQFPYKIAKSEFGRYQLDLLDTDNTELNSASCCYAFIERIEDFFPDINTTPTIDSLKAIDERISNYLSFIANISARGNRVLVADFEIQKSFPYSIAEQQYDSLLQEMVFRWNGQIYELKKQNVIDVIPYSHVVKEVGQSFSNKYWYIARAPFSLAFLEQYSKKIISSIFASHALSARALVLDLDNTLWKGVIGDDGIDGISLGGDYPGNVYKELQSLFLSLKERGILLTICSKNTENIALDAIDNHPQMLIKSDDVVAHRINWNPKSQNIKELAGELNLGVQSLCFIDDNPVERLEVRQNTPGVFVPELPEDPTEWYEFISQLPELALAQITDSDVRRAKLYKQRADLKIAEATFVDKTSFLRSLEMHINVLLADKSNFDRTHQLFTKTNQFNTTTTRYSREELQSFSESSDIKVIHITSKDKYSTEPEGIASIVLLDRGQQWIIDNFVMSCRVMGRDIEKAVIYRILLAAKNAGKSSVIGRYIPSAKNKPVEKLYENTGFTTDNDGNWIFDLEGNDIPAQADYLTLNWNI